MQPGMVQAFQGCATAPGTGRGSGCSGASVMTTFSPMSANMTYWLMGFSIAPGWGTVPLGPVAAPSSSRDSRALWIGGVPGRGTARRRASSDSRSWSRSQSASRMIDEVSRDGRSSRQCVSWIAVNAAHESSNARLPCHSPKALRTHRPSEKWSEIELAPIHRSDGLEPSSGRLESNPSTAASRSAASRPVRRRLVVVRVVVHQFRCSPAGSAGGACGDPSDPVHRRRIRSRQERGAAVGCCLLLLYLASAWSTRF